MSVINKMLQDLDKRQQAVPLYQSTLPANPHHSRLPLVLVMVLLLGGVASWYFLYPATLAASASVIPVEPLAAAAAVTDYPVAEETAHPQSSVEFAVPQAEDIPALQYSEPPAALQPMGSVVIATDPEQHEKQPVKAPLVTAPAAVDTVPESHLQIEQLPESPAQRMQRLQQRAAEAQQQGQTDAAIAGWQAVLQQDTGNTAAYLNLAAIWQQQGQAQTAYHALLLAVQQGISDARIYLQLANIAAQQQNWLLALQYLQTDFNLLAYPEYYGMKATVFQQLQQHQQALALFQQLLQAQPQQARWWLGAALSLEALSESRQAHQYYLQALHFGGNLSASSHQFIQQRLTATE
ncbi:hypothetical protein QE250_14780 [Chromatiaceae bacterium AAb-1]|nr:hypothetical protein [Chromatiaceae bacterium AAb-1]